MSEYMVGGIFGALLVLGASLVVDILIPGLLTPVQEPSPVRPEDVRPLTDRLSDLARDLRAEGHPAALVVEHAALDALNIERLARGFEAIPTPEPLLPPRPVVQFVLPDIEPIPLWPVRK